MPDVQLAPSVLRSMVRFMRALYRLHCLPAYQNLVGAELPLVACFKPGNESVMMGYDFHLAPQGPQLIEVNTNAGGGLLAYQAYGLTTPTGSFDPENRHQVDLLNSFAKEIALFSAVGGLRRLTRVAIIDHEPERQFLYEEMQLLRAMLESWGVAAVVVDPGALRMGADGVFLRHDSSAGCQGDRVDLIYNRHCDFYLQTPKMAGLQAAYLAGSVCLTPNPRIYGLLADKRRMILWSDEQKLHSLGVSAKDVACINSAVPACRLLAQTDQDQLWSERKQWVFKPVNAYGSRGVLLGSSISRQRFAQLDPDTTLVQRHVPPSLTFHPDIKKEMKTDFRLFVYQNKILGVTARLYRGQVTNFREAGSGYAPVRI